MSYNCIRYSGVIAGTGTQTIFQFEPPVSFYDKVITIDVFVSTGFDHENLIGRYITTYYIDNSNPVFFNRQTIFEFRKKDGPVYSESAYIESISFPFIVLEMDFGTPGICMYDIKIEC